MGSYLPGVLCGRLLGARVDRLVLLALPYKRSRSRSWLHVKRENNPPWVENYGECRLR